MSRDQALLDLGVDLIVQPLPRHGFLRAPRR
jgi:hypothetical protein